MMSLIFEGRYQEALTLANARISKLKAQEDSVGLAYAMLDRGSLYAVMGDGPRAESDMDQALHLLRHSNGPKLIDYIEALEGIVVVMGTYLPERAGKYIRQLADIKKDVYGPNSREYQQTLELLKRTEELSNGVDRQSK